MQEHLSGWDHSCVPRRVGPASVVNLHQSAGTSYCIECSIGVVSHPWAIGTFNSLPKIGKSAVDVPLLLVADEHLTGHEWVTVDAFCRRRYGPAAAGLGKFANHGSTVDRG